MSDRQLVKGLWGPAWGARACDCQALARFPGPLRSASRAQLRTIDIFSSSMRLPKSFGATQNFSCFGPVACVCMVGVALCTCASCAWAPGHGHGLQLIQWAPTAKVRRGGPHRGLHGRGRHRTLHAASLRYGLLPHTVVIGSGPVRGGCIALAGWL